MEKQVKGIKRAEYGEAYQLRQAEKYRERNNNHWKYRIDLAHGLVNEYALPRFKQRMGEEIVVVDIGCSIGTFAIEFARRGFSSYGIDNDPYGLKIAHQLCEEENVVAKFIEADITQSNWINDIPEIDIAICFDIFEHLLDKEVSILLQKIKNRLSPDGVIVFHTFPTEFDYIFYQKTFLSLPLIPIQYISSSYFNKILKIYASLIDVIMKIITGKNYKEHILNDKHCNLTTLERLASLMDKAGYEVHMINSSNIYPHYIKGEKRFTHQPIAHTNIFGVSIPKG